MIYLKLKVKVKEKLHNFSKNVFVFNDFPTGEQPQDGEQQETGIKMFTSKGERNVIEVEDADIRAIKGVSTEEAIHLSKNANISIGLSEGVGNKLKIGKLKMRAVDLKVKK
jgi:hypothetical protein